MVDAVVCVMETMMRISTRHVMEIRSYIWLCQTKTG
ncbi:hypothetical protein JOD01_002758 [Brevibacillus fulvus]|uniref:Uncharacterized protein n=1 Tax=Brevibacillus fulvus TaxID=1125967 RepID=A0A938Y3W8_9BACL|nr:hypothetical protein [Brevibacillus fulvus]